jgi:ribosomal protein S12 methylthiotransferase
MKERFYLVTLGCPKNMVDSEGIRQLLWQLGYTETDDPRHAHLIIANTCGFIASACDESLTTLRELAQQKRPHQLLVAAGCLPERQDLPLTELVPELDGVIGTQDWTQFPDFVEELKQYKRVERESGCYMWRTPDRKEGNLVTTFRRRPGETASAYVKIADGCDARCAYCTIPDIKGPQQSKRPKEVIREAKQLVAQDVKELILIAQDTTAYGRDLEIETSLADLLAELTTVVPEESWIRLMYTYPQHISSALVDIMASQENVCRYIDMPLQHSHPDVLRRMRRSPNTAQVRELIHQLREAMPDIALRTTFIVGYPGETEAEFEHLMGFMEEIAFDKVGVFPYSPEEGTPAASLPDQVPDEVKEERFHQAMLLQQGISEARNQAQVGRRLKVLIEGHGDGISVGRTYRDAPEIDGLVFVSGEVDDNQFVDVEIVEAMEYDLVGDFV